ncbi:MAG: TRAP transporter substrate-binding protein DctP [Treponema sp.]|nr:TRAP transporter substrate-binding protein DctP [Treponema sp.]
MKKIKLLIILLILTAAAGTLYAQRVIKVASMVPENTPWGSALNKMAAEWTAACNGEVTFQIFHNGVAGSELDVLRKLKLNQIQAAVFSTVGMSAISQEIMTLSVPFLIRTDDELDIILANAKDDLEKLLAGKGFQVIAWARAGWVKVFSKTPVYTPAELKRIKLGTVAGQAELMQAFKSMGYQMIPVDITEIVTALNSGMIDAVYQSPLIVAGNQVFGITKNMMNVNVAPIMGGLIMNQPAWRSIPDKYKPKILEIAKTIEKEMDMSIISLEKDAINTMKSYGLTINDLTSDQLKVWYDETDKAMPSLLGTTFNRDLYNRFSEILKNYRSSRGTN